MFRLKKNVVGGPITADTVESLVTNSLNNRSIECSPDSCANFTAIRFRVQESGDYYLRIDFGFPENRTLPYSRLNMTGVTMDYGGAVAAGLIKILLLLYTIFDFSCYCCNLRRARLEAANKPLPFVLSFEQKFLFGLNVSMLLYFDPVGIAHSFAPTVFT